MKKTFLLFILLASIISKTSAQELYCNVQVNSRQVEGTEKQIFETLQSAIFEFINNRIWTNYTFEVEERIECTMLITIDERVSSEEFSGSINVALRRPVFNSSYNSPILNYVDDDFYIKYQENQPLDFSENTYLSNLTSIVGYYVYMILGLDFDTFIPMGGTGFYEKAESIVNTAQSSNRQGWRASEGTNNRYWLVENLLNPAYKPIRSFLYDYHRKGLDVMYDNPDQGRAAITESLDYLKQAYDARPGLFLIQLIMDAKREEIIQIYSEASNSQKATAVNILKEIDPAHSSEFDNILN